MIDFERLDARVHQASLDEWALAALRSLPLWYEVNEAERLYYSMPGSREVTSYFPAFEICDAKGTILVLEVMKGISLSLINLARLVEIDKLVRKNGKNYLVLLLGEEAARVHKRSMPEFAALHIKIVATGSDVVNAVTHEFTFRDRSDCA